MAFLQLQVLNWWSFSYIISANLCAVLFHFLLINDVRMTTFTHQLLSRKTSIPEVWQCECKYSIGNAACPSMVLRIQPGGKLDTMWRWQRLAPDIKARRGRYKWSLQQDGVPSHTTRNTEICSMRTFRSLSQTFCPPDIRIFRIWTADGLPSSKFLVSWQNEENDC